MIYLLFENETNLKFKISFNDKFKNEKRFFMFVISQ